MMLVKTEIHKLKDEVLLESVSGGVDTRALGWGGLCITGASILSGVSCGVGTFVCQHCATSKRAQGDIESAEKLEKAARILGITALGVGVGGTGVGLTMFGRATYLANPIL